MNEIIAAFGVDLRLIIIQIFNFVLLLAALSYFLYKPLLRILDERQQTIAQGVRDSENASKNLASAEEEKRAILSEAEQEAEKVILAAQAHAEEKGMQIIEDAEQRSERIVLDATTKAEELRATARRESEAEIASLALLAAEKILKEKQTT